MNDENIVAGIAVGELIKASFNSVLDGASKTIRESWQKIFEDFEPYMLDTYRRNRNVRILCQKERDVDLYDVYVKSNFTSGRDSFDDDEIIQYINEGKNVIINGNGGAGKNFFHETFVAYSSGSQFQKNTNIC